MTEVRFDKKGRRIGAPPVESLSTESRAAEAARSRPRAERNMVMAHPVRRAILGVFSEDRNLEASVRDLFQREDFKAVAGSWDETNLNYHCKYVERAGMIEVVRVELVRGAVKTIFGLTDAGRAFLDGEGSHARPDSVLDEMARLVRACGEGAYSKLVDLLASTGRDLGEADHD